MTREPDSAEHAHPTARRPAGPASRPTEASEAPPRRRTSPPQDRDRVLDAVKALALVVVVLAHSLAWDVSTGEPRNVLDVRPYIAWITWTLQPLPLFFAAGAVANLGSWRRNPDAGDYLRRRLSRLTTPAIVYAAFWTLLLLPASAFVPEARPAGAFLSQLLWFLGVYAAAVIGVPLTSRWTAHPFRTLTIWLGVIVVVDVVRLTVAPAVGWLNLILVWAFLHQLGYHLPQLREHRPRLRLVGLAAIPFGLSVALAALGPYSSSLVTRAGDPDLSNVAPPTVVIALYGLAQVLVLAALWPRLTRLLARERLWMAIGFVALRAIGIYLWHIPWVLFVTATAWTLGMPADPFSRDWWLAHAAGVVLILTMAWFTAGIAAKADAALLARGAALRPNRLPASPLAVVVALALLAITTSGFATGWGPAFLGIHTSSALNLAVLVAAWAALVAGGRAARHQAQPSAT